ncbi:hypothetical protein PM082_016786 [Marasmius tenuissimus]|nr:hypothetical protein PM082_016786 [Marasmius tenuissimus]
MFNRSRSLRISGGTFSVVHGTQHINYYTQSPRDQCRFRPEEEWKEEIYSEYERTLRGNIKLIKTISKTPEDTYDESASWVYGNDIIFTTVKARRVICLASVVNGTQESQPSLSIKYIGQDAKKLFKADILKFSQIKDPLFPQLRSFNDSDIPMVIFHDALIPVSQVIEDAQNSLEATLFIRTQAERVISDLVLSTDFRSSYRSIPWYDSTYLWIRPETGDICLGPAGPPLPRPFPTFNGEFLGPYSNVPPLPPNAYNNRTFFDYVLKNSTSEHVLQVLTIQGLESRSHPHEFVHYRNINHRWSSVQFQQQPMARFPAIPWNFTFEWYPLSEKPPETVIEDGRIRLTIASPNILLLWFRFRTDPDRGKFRHEAWMSQAVYVFNALGIPREEWEEYTMLVDTGIYFELQDIDAFHWAPLQHHGGIDTQLEPPYYLFILPPPRLPDTTPDVVPWSQAPTESLCYWSLDPNGDTVMPEMQRIALALPSFHQYVLPGVVCWKPEVYDLVRQWQEAKGFDPATTDFARSMGYPIVEILPQNDGRFEGHVEDNENSTEDEPSGWEPMQVDECSIFEAMPNSQDSIMQPERLEGSTSMDVEMEDCSTIYPNIDFVLKSVSISHTLAIGQYQRNQLDEGPRRLSVDFVESSVDEGPAHIETIEVTLPTAAAQKKTYLMRRVSHSTLGPFNSSPSNPSESHAQTHPYFQGLFFSYK